MVENINMTGDIGMSPVIFTCRGSAVAAAESIRNESMLPLQFYQEGPTPTATAEVLWEHCGCSRKWIRDKSMISLQFEWGGSNCYCRGALGALWLQQEQEQRRIDAPTAV